MPAPANDDPRRAYALILVASALFAAMFACVKLLPARIDSVETLFVRGLVGVAGAAMVLRMRGQRFRPGPLRANLVRSLCGVAAVLCQYYAVHEAGGEIATVNLLTQSAPLWILLLSASVIGERAPVRTRWALPVGLLGTALALGPSGHGHRLGMFLALASGAFSGLALLYVRKLVTQENASSVVLFFMGCAALVTAPFAIRSIAMHGAWQPGELGLLLAIGALGTGGQLLMTEAYRHGSAASVSTAGLAQVAFAALFSFVWLGSAAPPISAVTGGILVLGAGLAAVQPWRGRDPVAVSEPRARP